MLAHQHIIRKQMLEVAFEGTTDAFVFKEQLSLLCTQKLLPAIQKAFDEAAPEGKVIRADQLIIDVGELPEENWENLLIERVVEKLLGFLSSFSSSSSSSSSSGSFSGSSSGSFSGSSSESFSRPSSESFSGDGASHMEAAGVEELSEQENSVNLIFYFLATGLLPWNSTIHNKAQLLRRMEAAITSETFLNQLVYHSKSNPRVLERLVQQFGEAVLEKIITAGGVAKSLIVQLKELVFSLFDKMYFPAAERKLLLYQALLTSAFEQLKKQETFISTEEFEAGVFKELLKSFSGEQLAQAAETLHNGFSEQEDKAKQLVRQLVAQLSIGKQNDPEDFKEKRLPDSENPQFLNNNKDQEHSGKLHFGNSNQEQEYFISNAGLVLLHPFLASLFENVGYTEKNGWLTGQVQQRALVLSQYLVTGREEYPEFDLLLNKILLGYPADQSLPEDIVLSEFEKNEARDLLLSVIKHWAAIKNTSIEGLQSTFLQREGKIWYGDSKCYLKVAQKAVDILLGKLPWGMSIIKTPWMDNRMHVEWN